MQRPQAERVVYSGLFDRTPSVEAHACLEQQHAGGLSKREVALNTNNAKKPLNHQGLLCSHERFEDGVNRPPITPTRSFPAP
jgi:hypothetical protein